jgi:hypothetical protein
LTKTAFSKRHEIGVFLDKTQSKETISIFKSWWKKSKKVHKHNLKPLITKKRESSEEKSGSALPNLWKLPDKSREITYWLKPIGVSDDPVTENRFFSHVTDHLHFSTPSKTPRVEIGDILIGYGVGARRILSIYQATSKPQRVTKQRIKKNKKLRRWPWYVIGKNLSKEFGGFWQKYNLYANDLVDEFLKDNPNSYITKSNNKTLNAIMRGKDKIKLEPEFAKFIINRVKNISKE